MRSDNIVHTVHPGRFIFNKRRGAQTAVRKDAAGQGAVGKFDYLIVTDEHDGVVADDIAAAHRTDAELAPAAFLAAR